MLDKQAKAGNLGNQHGNVNKVWKQKPHKVFPCLQNVWQWGKGMLYPECTLPQVKRESIFGLTDHIFFVKESLYNTDQLNQMFYSLILFLGTSGTAKIDVFGEKKLNSP